MMDSFESFAACNLKINCMVMKVYEVPLTMALHHSDIKRKVCCTKNIPRSFVIRLFAYNRLRYQVSMESNMTIAPLVMLL